MVPYNRYVCNVHETDTQTLTEVRSPSAALERFWSATLKIEMQRLELERHSHQNLVPQLR
jgi:hypothetical protein